jgi:periplasmic protein CpxP/Spy
MIFRESKAVASRIIGGEKTKGRQIMKRSIGRFTYPAVFVIVAAFLCAMAILGSPAASLADDEAGRIEARIKAFHSKLGITEAQEEQWNKLAQVMRENATTMHTLLTARKGKGAMNAVDDLKSYNEMLEAQAAGLRNFIPAFEELYAAMSDDQKKNADQIFTKFVQKKGKKK